MKGEGSVGRTQAWLKGKQRAHALLREGVPATLLPQEASLLSGANCIPGLGQGRQHRASPLLHPGPRGLSHHLSKEGVTGWRTRTQRVG